jgi:putative heme transporter
MSATGTIGDGDRHGARSHRGRDFVTRHRRTITAAVVIAAVVGFVYFVVPQISGLSSTLWRLRHADPWWIGLGVIFEALSLGGYVLLFRTVFSCHGVRIGWRESYQINLAGTVASKLLATAGAGGVALTVWALRAAGLAPRVIARRMLSFELLLYSVFVGALLIVGAGLRAGAMPGRAPWTLTVVPAAIAGGAVLAILSMRAWPARVERRVAARATSAGRVWRVLAKLAGAPSALREATSVAVELVRQRKVGIVGALLYWGLDMATLWAALHAFGAPPPLPAVVMSYFVGQLANVLPLPGGVGGVEGGTIGALIAFGAHASLAVLGVLAYRLISFWLPTVPGTIAYVRLRRTVRGWREGETHPQEATA